MPVYKLVEEMPHDEMTGWFAYLERRPLGWRDDLRASYIVQAQGVKQKSTDLFPSLKIIMRKNCSDPIDSLRGSSIYRGMLSAKGGDKLEFL